ncbi:TPA: SLATT domain-containing protein, partial [Pseudomonas aeruginosa]|nr:SLATT domain-containing protein [Pseudomonas aeruginosa]
MSDVVREDADYNRFLILELANLELDSKIGKDRHFIAADRKNNRRIVLGLFSVIGTAVIASKAIKDVFQAVPQISEYETIFISVVSLLVGVSTAILGFLGLEKQVAQHRFVGNMYIEVARKARALISRLQEGESS